MSLLAFRGHALASLSILDFQSTCSNICVLSGRLVFRDLSVELQKEVALESYSH